MSSFDEASSQSASWLLAQFEARTLSPVEITRATLSRLEAWQPSINAFCVVDAERAMEAARASERRWMRRAPCGLLDGVCASIKDVVLTRDWPTLKGSRTVDRGGPWTEDSPVTAHLRAHGAVLLGKTTVPEFGWKATGDSPLTGSTRNPWSLERTSGGSSAGAAASLAAGIGALAVGSDGGGSIRIPASFCGVVGLKPTFGLVPYSPPSAMGLLGHCGPMARTVEDTALMLAAIGQPDVRDPFHLPASACAGAFTPRTELKGVRVAFSPRLGNLPVDPDVASRVESAVSEMARLGADVEEVAQPFPSPRESFDVLWKAGAANLLAATPPDRQAWLDPGLRRSADEGARFGVLEYVRAGFASIELGRHMGMFHQRFDLLVTPTVGVKPLPVGEELSNPAAERDWIDWAGFSYPFNMTRQPAVSLPCGFTRDGLPVGIQLIGRLYADYDVLAAAAALQSALGPSPLAPFPR